MRWLIVVTGALLGCGRMGFDTVGNSAGPDAPPGGDIDAAVDGNQDPPSFKIVALANTNPPSARRSSGAATAPDERIWIYGGFSGGAQAGVASYTPGNGTWTMPAAINPPPARERHALDFDAANDRLVLFGGFAGQFPNFTHHDELYIFAPATSTWTQIPKAGTWPAPRKDSVMFWIPSLNQLLLYGGNNGSGAANRFGDLYTLSIDVANATATWTLLAPGGDAAPRQSAPCAAYDPTGRRLILHGGEPTDGSDANTTYQYLLDTNVWQLDTTTGTSPGGRSFSSCAWDATPGRLVLYGGQSAGSPVAGSFSYDPATKKWDVPALAAGSTSPGNLSDGGAAYSPALGGMFVFGGRTNTTTYSNQSLLVDLK